MLTGRRLDERTKDVEDGPDLEQFLVDTKALYRPAAEVDLLAVED